MQQITDAILDQELGAAPFLVIRALYRRSKGETVLLSEDRYETFGTVHPAKASDLLLVPEEYRHETVLVFHSPVGVSLGGPLDQLRFYAPDRILFRMKSYLVISVRDWMSFGFCRVLAVLRKGEVPHEP